MQPVEKEFMYVPGLGTSRLLLLTADQAAVVFEHNGNLIS